MKKLYFLRLPQAVCFLLTNLLLQNCGGSANLPFEGEEAAETITIEQEGEQGKKSTEIEIEPEEEQTTYSLQKYGKRFFLI